MKENRTPPFKTSIAQSQTEPRNKVHEYTNAMRFQPVKGNLLLRFWFPGNYIHIFSHRQYWEL